MKEEVDPVNQQWMLGADRKLSCWHHVNAISTDRLNPGLNRKLVVGENGCRCGVSSQWSENPFVCVMSDPFLLPFCMAVRVCVHGNLLCGYLVSSYSVWEYFLVVCKDLLRSQLCECAFINCVGIWLAAIRMCVSIL